ncbi:MAG: hypothetical protein LUF87_01670, partial [Alistipes sp.]|nr:hypothetical protein [Alistipes sp.]
MKSYKKQTCRPLRTVPEQKTHIFCRIKKEAYLCTTFFGNPATACLRQGPEDKKESVAQLVEHNTFNVGVLGS